MITIVKGKEKIVCSYKTYEEQFKQLGYLPASEPKKEAKEEVASSFESKSVEEVEIPTTLEEIKEEKKEEDNTSTRNTPRRRTSAKKEDK